METPQSVILIEFHKHSPPWLDCSRNLTFSFSALYLTWSFWYSSCQSTSSALLYFANQWFCSYLRNRKQTCLVDCNKSSDTYLPCGLPQGTILGPLLFLLYINDLANCLMHSQPRMYADDTSITYASNDVEEIERCVNIELDRIRIWLAANKLTLNTTKPEFLLIGSRQRLSTLERNPQIEINKFPIKQVSTSKSLGVHIDGNLSWESHINEISKKIASGITAIKRIRYFLPFEILLNVYNSLVQAAFTRTRFPMGTVS